MKHLYIKKKATDKLNEITKLYEDIAKSNKNKTSNVLMLVNNNMTKLTYQKTLNLEYSEEINIITYINFIKKEIVKFWPIVQKQLEDNNENTIAPTFINNSLSEYIINEKVNEKRYLEGYFNDITSNSRNISNSIRMNINKGAQALIDFKSIGEKIYLSKFNKSNLMRFSYSQMNEIIDYYIDTLLKNSMLDDSLSIYLYHNYLLNNQSYKEALKQSIDYLIVESLENCTTAEVDFIDFISEFTKDTYMYFDKTKDYSVFNNIDMEYLNDKIIKKIITKDIIEDIKIEDIYLLDTKVQLNENSQLYNEMIQASSEKVIELVRRGVEPKDIVIISPVNSNILDYQINNVLTKANIKVSNTKKDKKIIEYPYALALVVATCIFYDYVDYIKDEELINFIEIVLGINRIKALCIYKRPNESEEYQQLVTYIKDKRKDDINISEFLIRFYIDKLLNLKDGKENVKICKQIIQESDIFTNNISKLGLDRSKNKEKIFIEALKTTIKDFYSTIDINELKSRESVLIATPYSYISSRINRPIHIWVDIGSNAWNMKIEKDISNLIVLRKTFEERKIYTDMMEEKYKKYYLYNMIYNLLIDTKEVYAYKSEYTINGYIQESILYSLLLKLIDKKGGLDE